MGIMDAWKGGRIIYAYLIWVVFKATTAGGLYDTMNSLVDEMVVEAGKNVTLGCPGVTEDSLVLMLEWRANGMRLLEYKSRSTTVVRRTEQNRMSLSLKNYSLQLHPVTAADSGMYECLVNNRNTPEAVIKLIVRGKWRNVLNRLPSVLLFSCDMYFPWEQVQSRII
ncbi:uncharacterized protein LOC105427378 [Pogonomyrmex barbatus]|uniref:Uncharacterized protein LOC105427378 n=1 Tax=Pogonomyrmex barbatus TaxID=144034 RepID=A0A8N1S7M3_9HYME|nr:uncharacterized protein LOC105427378 [Pogonomyrmex barbatus]